jgi:hypothetical protein
VFWCNAVLKLGIDPNTNIFGREDILNYSSQPHPKFTNTYNLLIDNLQYLDHTLSRYNKIKFLNKIPRTQYIHVKDFMVWTEPLEKDTEYFEWLKSDIMESLPSIKTEI